MTSNASMPSVLPVMTIVEYMILLVLAMGPSHGYGIMQEIATRTNNEIRLVPGTLYGALKRMLRAGWIEELQVAPAPDLDNERRRYYQLSSQGREKLLMEIRRKEYLAGEGRIALTSGGGDVEGETREGNRPNHNNGNVQLLPI